MTIEETKLWLERARALKAEMARKQQRIQALADMATSTTAGVSEGARSDSPNLQRMESVMCRIIDLENELREDADTLMCVREEIATAVALLENPREIAALNDRYVCCMSINDTADDLLLTVRHVWKIIHSGVEKLSGLLV